MVTIQCIWNCRFNSIQWWKDELKVLHLKKTQKSEGVYCIESKSVYCIEVNKMNETQMRKTEVDVLGTCNVYGTREGKNVAIHKVIGA